MFAFCTVLSSALMLEALEDPFGKTSVVSAPTAEEVALKPEVGSLIVEVRESIREVVAPPALHRFPIPLFEEG